MKKKTFFIFVAYIWTKTLLKLTFHPYLAVRETLRRPILLPVIFTPFLGILILFFAAKIGSILITLHALKREVVAIFLSTTLISILLWQMLLLYLLFSFLIASKKK